MRFALAAVLVLTACGGTSPAPAQPPTPAPIAMTLKALQRGDRACYVIVESPQGEQSIEGDFELCEGGARDASALIGQRVSYATEHARVQAASCEGNPDCEDSDEVDLVISISPAP